MLNQHLPSSSHPLIHGNGAHQVQFYDREEFLYEIVGGFIEKALAAGEPVILIATPEHRRGFSDALIARGFDPDRVVFEDARETMATFMTGGMPDTERFLSAMGARLERLTATHGRLSAYGEMVDLLWRDGNPDAAIRLEKLWNELGTLYPFSLLCAYPMGNFYRSSHAQLFEQVCEAHGRVFPAETFDRGAEDDARLREIAVLQQRAAALEREIERRRELEVALREALDARRAAEEELRGKLDENSRLYALAQDNIRTKDEFLATLSHELRTPLTAILGWARLLNMRTLDEETTRVAYETIERSARTQASLIDDLLDLSRVVTGKLAMRSEPVDLGTTVGNAVETLRLAAEARAINIRFQAPAERTIISGDSTRLQQVAWNLIANAVKFCEAGSEVTVAVDRNEDAAKLIVSDRGQGISAEFLPYVFEPFRQADGASTRNHNGLGLGLAIVKYITEMHGGTVAARSDGAGTGATFTVTLPLG